MSKYNFDLELESRNSLSLLIERIVPNSRVLEFGPAHGRMTKYLKEKLNCEIYTVELDEDAAKDAAKYSKEIVVGNIETYEWLKKYENISFDYIVFADVLEHLYNPEKVLEKAKTLLKEDGSVLISLPNIAHNSIIMELLDDRFTYHDTGLLDNTHIRFFTKKSIDDFIKQCGLQIAYETASFAKPEETEFGNSYYDVDDSVAATLFSHKYGEVYQFIIEAKKKIITKIVDLDKKESALLFYDTGQGFNDHEMTQTLYSYKSDKKIQFVLEKPIENVKSIRIDPLEYPLKIKLSKITIDEKVVGLEQVNHNGVMHKENTLSFSHFDPQITVKMKEERKVKKVELYYDFISDVRDVKLLSLEEKEQQLQQKEQQLQQKEQQIQNLNQTVAELHELAQSMRIKNRLKRGVKKVVPQRVIKISKFIKHNPHSIKQGWQLLRSQGLNAVVDKIKKIDSISTDRLLNSYHYVQPVLSDEIVNEMRAFKSKPLISIIMPVYNVDPKWLKLAIDSVENQWYENWELCIVDDKSTNTKTIEYLKSIQNEKIKIKFIEQNLNISGASNEALKMADGEYIALMDNDDELTPDALYEVVKAINEHNAEFIYSDEDKIEMDGSFCEPHFKPDFAPDMFLSQNYISHLGIIKKELIEKVGGWEVGLEGSQDYDLYLKVLEHTDKIFHITKVLYHWRKIPGSTASEFGEKSFAQEAGKKALENAINRRGIKASVSDGKYTGTYRINYKIIDNPLISIIIPFKDKPEFLKMCVESILKKSTYDNFEIIGISNNSQVEETFKEMQRLSKIDKRVSFYEYNVPFNFSDINNHAVKEYAKGEHIVLLNNDIEIITSRWLEELLMFSQREDVGVVGAKLYYSNETIQHAGVIIGVGGIAGHSHKYFQREDNGYFSRLHLIQNLSALTAAMFMVKKEIYNKVGWLNEEDLKVAFNDVDFCLRVREQGYLNIFNPYCEAYHHESISRGAEDSPEKVARFNSEVTYMKKRHKTILQKGDPYYNPNLTLDREDFGLR